MDMKRIEFSNGYESIWEKYFAFIIFLSLNFLYRRLSRYVYFWTLVDNQLCTRVDCEDVAGWFMAGVL